jgi:hypothetical protein
MTEELPAYAHNLGKALKEWFHVSDSYIRISEIV